MYDQIIKTGYHIYNYVNIFISSANTTALVVILLSFVHVLSIQFQTLKITQISITIEFNSVFFVFSIATLVELVGLCVFCGHRDRFYNFGKSASYSLP